MLWFKRSTRLLYEGLRVSRWARVTLRVVLLLPASVTNRQRFACVSVLWYLRQSDCTKHLKEIDPNTKPQKKTFKKKDFVGGGSLDLQQQCNASKSPLCGLVFSL